MFVRALEREREGVRRILVAEEVLRRPDHEHGVGTVDAAVPGVVDAGEELARHGDEQQRPDAEARHPGAEQRVPLPVGGSEGAVGLIYAGAGAHRGRPQLASIERCEQGP